MIELVLTTLVVVGFLVVVNVSFWTILKAHSWLRPAVPGWFKPDLRDKTAKGWLAHLPRAPIRDWRWSRRRHRHQWGPWRRIHRESGDVWGQGCEACPVIRMLGRGDFTTTEETIGASEMDESDAI